jgi:hypothetical protein
MNEQRSTPNPYEPPQAAGTALAGDPERLPRAVMGGLCYMAAFVLAVFGLLGGGLAVSPGGDPPTPRAAVLAFAVWCFLSTPAAILMAHGLLHRQARRSALGLAWIVTAGLAMAVLARFAAT